MDPIIVYTPHPVRPPLPTEKCKISQKAVLPCKEWNRNARQSDLHGIPPRKKAVYSDRPRELARSLMGRFLTLVLGVLGVVLGFLVSFSCAAALYTVGDGLGWNLNVNYTQWASKYTFALGDSVVFVFGSTHSVLVVNEIDFVVCNIRNPLQTLQSGRAISITARRNYFICGIPGHCIAGMKVAIFAALGGGGSSSDAHLDLSLAHGSALPTIWATIMATILPPILGLVT